MPSSWFKIFQMFGIELTIRFLLFRITTDLTWLERTHSSPVSPAPPPDPLFLQAKPPVGPTTRPPATTFQPKCIPTFPTFLPLATRIPWTTRPPPPLRVSTASTMGKTTSAIPCIRPAPRTSPTATWPGTGDHCCAPVDPTTPCWPLPATIVGPPPPPLSAFTIRAAPTSWTTRMGFLTKPHIRSVTPSSTSRPSQRTTRPARWADGARRPLFWKSWWFFYTSAEFQQCISKITIYWYTFF